MEKVRSQKGKLLILLEGFQYREARTNADSSISWRCVDANCKGRIRVLGNDSNAITPHNHAPNPAKFRIPNDLQSTSRGDNFVLWDSGSEDVERIFLFGTTSNLQVLREHEHWSVDGTFKIAPELFYQVFTVHALIGQRYLPMIYALVPNKTERSYARIFEQLMLLEPALRPSSVLCDFEKSIQNAAANTLQGPTIAGCLFHLGQCLWRKIQECNLAGLYRDQENVRMHLKMLLALSFIPEGDVIGSFEELTANSPPEIDEVLNYWESTYIGIERRNRRTAPRFPISVWNVSHRVQNMLPRTNNSVEGWHRAFQQSVDCHHPSIFKLIEQFRKEQDHTEILLERFNNGHQAEAAPKCKYVQLNRRLEALAENYDPTNKMQYLRGIANNLEL